MPLVVLEPPPVSEDAYRSQYAAYVEARDRRDALSGSFLAHRNAREDLRAEANREVARLSAALAPYRSWWRAQRSLGALLHRLPLKRVVLLFDPAPGDIELIEAVPKRRIGETRHPLIPKQVPRHRIAADDLVALSDAARRLLGSPRRHGPWVEVREDAPRAWLEALAEALRLGLPLQPSFSGETSEREESPVDAEEAVLVEACADAGALIGVQYAHAHRAKLVVVPEPTMAEVDAAVAQMGAIVLDQDRGETDCLDGLSAIERAVSTLVPDRAVSAVDDLPLTAFTRGVPYNFVRRGETTWAEKPIGHVVVCPAFVVITELGATTSDPGLSVILDPGFFPTSETRDIEAILRDAGDLPIVLSEDRASGMTLIRVGEGAPLDLLYINTHGSRGGIALSDLSWPGFTLLRQPLRNQPIVFNNSCDSWHGVGREFVRMGARGYVGTLWSVDTNEAAGLGRIAIQRSRHDGRPMAAAIRTIGASPTTERAYIFVGTVGSRLAGSFDPRRIRAKARAILALIEGIQRASTSDTMAAVDEALIATLWRAADAGLASGGTPSEAERVEAVLARARIAARVVTRAPEALSRARELVAEAISLLRRAEMPGRTRAGLHSELLLLLGRAEQAAGSPDAAVATLEAALKAARASERRTGPIHLALSDAHRVSGRHYEALEAAERAHAEGGRGADSAAARLAALGRIVQLARLSDPERALRGAREGFAAATLLDHVNEQVAFKGDEARALMGLERWPEALEAAVGYRNAARRAYMTQHDLAANGLLGQIHVHLGEPAEALECVEEGLAVAREANARSSIADFLMDRARLHRLDGEATEAIVAALEAAELYLDLGQAHDVRRALGSSCDILHEMQDGDDRAAEATAVLRVVQTEARLFARLPDDLRSAAATMARRQLLRLLRLRAPADLARALSDLAGSLEAEPSAAMQPDRTSFVAILRVAVHLALDDVGGARAIAQHSDTSFTSAPIVSFIEEATAL